MNYPTTNEILSPTSWTQEEKKNFVEAKLSSINRKGMDKVLEYLRNSDFYYAPSSSKYHSNYQGGLLDHSILVLSVAMELREAMIKMKPELEVRLSVENVIVSALLHDVCKISFYKPKNKWKKDENDNWITYLGYDIEDTFPIGHGEKSVILLQWLGLELTADEMLAIRYHMGLWSNSIDYGDPNRTYFRAVSMCPLLTIIQNADFMTSNLLENIIN